MLELGYFLHNPKKYYLKNIYLVKDHFYFKVSLCIPIFSTLLSFYIVSIKKNRTCHLDKRVIILF
jgi:hypothetical protein